MPKPTAEQLAAASERPIRLACSVCDRDDHDGIAILPAGWADISEEQSLEASLTTYEEGDGDPPPGYSVLDWWTHIGVCPACRLEGHD